VFIDLVHDVLGLVHQFSCFCSWFLLLIYQLSQMVDHSMPLLGDYSCYTDLKYTQPLDILIAEANTTKVLLCSS
jgi:hypothetical protein